MPNVADDGRDATRAVVEGVRFVRSRHPRRPSRARAVGPDSTSPPAEANERGDHARRPIESWEAPLLEALGHRLRRARRDSGLTQAGVAVASSLSERSLRRLEAGQRRTRRSTLQRLADSMTVTSGPDAVDLLDEFLEIVGPALAAESAFADRVARRRGRREANQRQEVLVRRVTLVEPVVGGLLETHFYSRRTSRRATRDRTYQRLRPS